MISCVAHVVGPDLKCNQSIAVDQTCVNGEPWKPHFALNSSIVGLKNNTDIQRELLAHGPVTAAFKVFEDVSWHYPRRSQLILQVRYV